MSLGSPFLGVISNFCAKIGTEISYIHGAGISSVGGGQVISQPGSWLISQGGHVSSDSTPEIERLGTTRSKAGAASFVTLIR
jgi:hypothetical protein